MLLICLFSKSGNHHMTDTTCMCLWKHWNKQATRCAGAVHGKKLSKPQKLVVKSHKHRKRKNLCMGRSADNTQVPSAELERVRPGL